MTKKRLGICSPGGIGSGAFSQGLPAIEKIVRHLAERFDVTFYSLASVDPGFLPSGYRLRSPSDRLDQVGLRGGRWVALATTLLRDHLASRYDVLLSFWGYPMGTAVVAFGKMLRVPAIVMLLGAETADVPAAGYGHLGRPVARRLVFWTCAGATALIAVSKYQLDVLRSRGFQRPDAQVVPIGAEEEMFLFEPRPPSSPLKIIHVANLTEVKDQTTLLRAFAALRADLPAKLRIVGTGSQGPAIADLVGQLGLTADVELAGAVPFAKMPDQYRWADMFLLTSLSEGQNRSLTEAALSGVLQVSTPVGHIADLGEDVAVVVKPGDPADVARRIKDIAADRPSWERKVSNARAWASGHDMRWTVEQIARIIDDLART